jgi:hypothetical protein
MTHYWYCYVIIILFCSSSQKLSIKGILSFLTFTTVLTRTVTHFPCFCIRFVPGTEADKGVLYGVAVVRAQGPDEYVQAFPEYVTEKEIVAMQTVSKADSGLATTLPTQISTQPTPAPLNVPSMPQRPVGAFGLGGMGPMGGMPGPGPLGLSPRAAGGAGQGSFGMGIPQGSFSMGGQNVSVLPVRTAPLVAAVSGVTALSPVTVPAVPLPVPAALKETIKKVAQFCASNGASTISMLKKKEGAKNVMPFLFEGQVGYEEFLSTLKNILGMASATSNTSNSSSSVPPPARP